MEGNLGLCYVQSELFHTTLMPRLVGAVKSWLSWRVEARCYIKGGIITHTRTFIVLHSVVYMKSDRNNCVKNVKRKLEQFKAFLTRQVHVNVGFLVTEMGEHTVRHQKGVGQLNYKHHCIATPHLVSVCFLMPVNCGRPAYTATLLIKSRLDGSQSVRVFFMTLNTSARINRPKPKFGLTADEQFETVNLSALKR